MANKQPNLDSLFLAALDIQSADERTAFLKETCGLDVELQRQVEQLLHSHALAESFLDKPAPELAVTIYPNARGGDLAASLEAGLAAGFRADEAVVIGNGNHSVLRSLNQTYDVPRVVLRESPAERNDPIVQPKSAEMPDRNSDSRYQLQGEIARGGMGAILKGRDTDLGRDLAIKVLLDAHKHKPEVVQRFIEEAQIGGQLQHPGIAPVYELGQFNDKRPYFSMKLVKGETFAKLLSKRENPAADRGKLLAIFEQVCQTMAYAHSRGVIHRDLKPANIMVGAFGEVQVMDWGLAKVLPAGGIADEKKALTKHKDVSIIQTLRSIGSDTPGTFGAVGSQTQMGSVMGTPAYMPPEQALGEIDNMDERADVFGLGAILCEILSGKPPYVGTDDTAVFRQASRGKLENCMARLDACEADADLVALTKHCLELEPKHRPRDACVLAERVSRYLESVDVRLRETEMDRAAQVARVEQQQQSARMLRKVIAGLAVVALIAVGTSLVAGKFWQDATIARRNAELSEGTAQTEADRAKQNAAEAEASAAEANRQREAAQQAQLNALDQTYLATLNEVRSMRLARQSGWRSAALERLKELVQLKSRNSDRADLRTEALACLAEIDIRLKSKSGAEDIGAWHVRYSPDGQILALNDDKRNLVLLRDAATNEELRSIPKAVGLTPFAFHPSGALATSPAAGRVAFYPISEKQSSLPEIMGEGFALNLAFSRSGDRLAVAWGEVDLINKGCAVKYHQVTVHDTATGERLWAAELPANSPGGYKLALALSPDGQTLATVGPNVEVRLFSVGTDEEPTVLGKLDTRICTIAFHPDGQSLVAAGRLTGAVWDLESRSELFRIHAPEGGLWDVVYSPDGQLLAGAINDGTVRLWDSRSGRELAVAPSETGHACLSIAFAPQGDRFMVGGGSLAVFEIHGRRESRYEASATNGIAGLAFDKTRQAILSAGGDRRLRAWKPNEPVARVIRDLQRRENSSVLRIAPDGRQLAVGFDRWLEDRNGLEFSISVWTLDDAAAERRLNGPQQPVDDLAFAPSGKRLTAASRDGGLYLWEFETGELLYRLDLGPIRGICFLDETQLVVAVKDRLLLLAAEDGAVEREVTLPAEAAAFVIIPDRRAVLVGAVDGTIHRVSLPELALEQSRKVLDQPSDLVMAISPEGNLLAVTARTGPRNLLIDPETLNTLARLPETDKRMNCLEFDQEGRYFAMGGAQIILWDLALVRGELIRLGLDFGELNAQEAVAIFAESLKLAPDRASKAKIIATAAPLEGVLEKLAQQEAADGQFQAELARHFAEQGKPLLAEEAGKKARTALREMLQEEPENSAAAADMAELLISGNPALLSNQQRPVAVTNLIDPWAKLAFAYQLMGDQKELDRVLKHHPAAAIAIAELHVSAQAWEPAIAAYSQLITEQTTDGRLLANRAAAYMSAGQWELARTDWLRAAVHQPELATVAFDRLTVAKRWNEAAEFGQMLMEQQLKDSMVWVRVAPIMALSNDEAAYKKFCNQVVLAAGKTPSPFDADRAVKVCLLRPGMIDLAELPGDALARSLDEGTAPEASRPWFWAARALLAYRSGEAETAVEYVAKSEAGRPHPFAHALNLAILSIAQHELQSSDEARRNLKSGRQLIAQLQEGVNASGHHDLLIAEVLLREAEERINGKPESKPSRADAESCDDDKP